MPCFRAQAEVRRHLRDGTWHLVGVLVDGTWHAAAAGLHRPGFRLVEADLCRVAELPPIIAPSLGSAVRIAGVTAQGAGYSIPSDLRWIPDERSVHRIELRLDEALADLGVGSRTSPPYTRPALDGRRVHALVGDTPSSQSPM